MTNFSSFLQRSAALIFVSFILIAAFLLWNSPAKTEAAAQSEILPNYDIRTDENAKQTIAKFIVNAGKTSSAVESDRKRVARAGAKLRSETANLKIEYNEDLKIPEVVSPDFSRDINFLTKPDRKNRAEILRDFINRNNELFGLSAAQIVTLEKTADYTNPDGNLSFVHFEQKINSIPVFRGEIKAGFTQKNEIVRVINNLAPRLDYESLPTVGRNAEQAVADAAKHINLEAGETDLKRIESAANDLKVTFGRGQFENETTAEKIYFPVDYGVARLAWRVLLWQKTDAFYVIVDAQDGTLLWRKNITDYQTQTATYGIYGWLINPMRTADSPTPMSPGCATPLTCPEPPIIQRGAITLVGNESPNAFNNLGWIPDTGLPVRTPPDPNVTDGNAVEAGVDRVSPNGVDAPVSGNPNRVFNFTYNPAPGSPAPGEDPLLPEFQKGSVTQAFYVVNRWHDEMYRVGFTEQAGNFQHFNFGRGGSEGDRISAEIQDSSGTNNANMATPADGNRPRLQMYIFTGTTPNRDGALDSHVLIHELTHGIAARLHGNSVGLGTQMAVGMSEGWSDYYPLALLSDSQENLFATYPVGGYAIKGLFGSDGDYYYGARRFPVALRAFRGANGFPHNPLTLANLNQGNCTNFESAFPPRGGTASCGAATYIGELWTNMLWEVRFRFINRLNFFPGNQKTMQIVTDGMKLAPLNPTLLQERDAMIAAAAASEPTFEASINVADVWRGFAVRGLGYGAQIISTNPVNVVESFSLPPNLLRPKRSDFDGDGKTDVSVFRPSESNWYLNRSTAGFAAINWGLSTDTTVAADYDGDGKTDIAVFRPTADSSAPDFYILYSANFTFSGYAWGLPGDSPLIEDYDGDGRDDVGVYRPSDGNFYALSSGNGAVIQAFKNILAGWTFSTGDFDGDGRGDIIEFNNGQWKITRATFLWGQNTTANWGTTGDVPVPADYDGDGIDDLAVFRPSEGNWYVRRASGGTITAHFGISTDIPVPGDYDGDGRNDIAVYRDGTWYINQSTAGLLITQFGLNGDVPTPRRYLP